MRSLLGYNFSTYKEQANVQRYNPKEIEPKWQAKWAEDKRFQAIEGSIKPKKYIIDMFPYPSGAAMHVGHVRNFTISDVLSQFHRQRGYNVLHTMGWDTFGLPAENYAIKTGTPPAQTAKANVANFKHQLQQLGMSYDWSREVNTSDPEYYRWTQWIFTQLFEHGLAYQKESAQWWCPFDKTVLANEQVENGRCWRCGNEVVKKNMKQWFFKITDYADQLLVGIDDLDWPEKIKTMQRNWIGKSVGAEIEFAVENSGQAINVFTTRPDTIFGATFLVLAPEHELLPRITKPEYKQQIEDYRAAAQKKSEIERQENKEKTGVFTGAYAINRVTGERIPVWTADYVLMGYGTGAIMAVPAHDDRDHAFAKAFNLSILEVVEPQFGTAKGDEKHKQAIIAIVRNPKTGEVLVLDWGPRRENWGGNLFIGGGIEDGEDPVETAKREIAEETGYTHVKHVAIAQTYVNNFFYSNVKNQNYHARFLPILFELVDDEQAERNLDDNEDQFTVRWVPEAEIAKTISDEAHLHGYRILTEEICYHGEGKMMHSGSYNGLDSSEAREKIVADLAEKGAGQEKVNYRMRDWLISRQRYWGAPIPIIHCEKDGAVAVPAADLPVVLPEVKDYQPDGSGKSVLGSVPDWVNVACPKCGGPAVRETDTMDGYACSSWYFLRYTDPKNDQQAWDPAKANYWLPIDYYCGGDHAVSHLLYSRFWLHFFADRGWIKQTRREPVNKLVYNGYILAHDGRKMSKSLGNTVNPDDLIDQGYGADSLRLFEMFIAPYEQNTNWNTNGVPGTFRFLQRVWTLVQEFVGNTGNLGEQNPNEQEILRVAHRTIKKVTQDLEELSFNTAVAAMMESVNDLYKLKEKDHFANAEAWRFMLESLTQLLAPFAPHITEELWMQLGHENSVHLNRWPEFAEKYLVSDAVTVVVQVNGKVRAQLQLPTGTEEVAVIAAAEADGNVQTHIAGKEILKSIYVPGKILNLVVR